MKNQQSEYEKLKEYLSTDFETKISNLNIWSGNNVLVFRFGYFPFKEFTFDVSAHVKQMFFESFVEEIDNFGFDNLMVFIHKK